jgi:hypothetical protein
MEKNLDHVLCPELARSWIPTEPEGPVRLSPEVLMKYAINLARDFETVCTSLALIPRAFGQYLLKPKRAFPEAD